MEFGPLLDITSRFRLVVGEIGDDTAAAVSPAIKFRQLLLDARPEHHMAAAE
jgi:hypothetical protein